MNSKQTTDFELDRALRYAHEMSECIGQFCGALDNLTRENTMEHLSPDSRALIVPLTAHAEKTRALMRALQIHIQTDSKTG